MGRRSGHIGEILVLFFVGVSTALCFDLTILHTNDVHGRFEETDKHGFSCVSNDACFGGVARIASVVKEVRNKEENVVLVDGGDRFTGTLWSAVYKGNASRVFFNELNYTAIVSGFSG
jgi:5'-nucleotidase